MKRVSVAGCLAMLMLAATAVPAHADITGFWGLTTSPAKRAARGFAIGLSFIVVGFEFEYATTVENDLTAAPGLKTGMLNGLVQTPTHTSLYLTAGGGFYRERLGTAAETNFGTNIGGGIKAGLVGPLRLRLDYRVFTLRGHAITPHPQRVYAGINLTF
jgi:hypothetical protein